MAGRYEVLDERFRSCIDPTAELVRLHTGSRWAEGPVYVPATRALLWSDVRGNRVLRWRERLGTVDVVAQPANFANGHTLDRSGRVVTCEHGTRRVVRTEADGSMTVLADRYGDKRLNSPNDVVVASDGSVWFTDPTYGIDSDEEGYRAESEIGSNNVYRVDPVTGKCVPMATDFVQPNGLAFAPDERLLYISDTGAGSGGDGDPPHLRVFRVRDDGALADGRVLARPPTGVFDGFRIDESGRIWTSTGAGVACYAPDGTLLGTIAVPETVANVEFGGPDRRRLFACATTSLYAVNLAVRGASRPG